MQLLVDMAKRGHKFATDDSSAIFSGQAMVLAILKDGDYRLCMEGDDILVVRSQDRYVCFRIDLACDNFVPEFIMPAVAAIEAQFGRKVGYDDWGHFRRLD